MKNTDKYQKMKNTSDVLLIAGVLISLLGMNKSVANNKEKSIALSVLGGILSAASLFNNISLLGRYGETEEPDEGKMLVEHTKNMLVIPVIDVLNIGYSLMDREHKIAIANRIKRFLGN